MSPKFVNEGLARAGERASRSRMLVFAGPPVAEDPFGEASDRQEQVLDGSRPSMTSKSPTRAMRPFERPRLLRR